MAFDNRLKLPAQYLRKAWFIILEDMIRDKAKYADILKTHMQLEGYDGDKLNHIIETFPVTKESFRPDGDERKFFDKENESPGKINYRINYDLGYRIKHGHTQKICRCIAYAISDNLKNNIFRLSERKLERSNVIQNQFHRHLSEVRMEGKVNIFVHEFIPIGEAMAITILNYALFIVKRRKLPGNVEGLLINFLKDINAIYSKNDLKHLGHQLKPIHSKKRHQEFWVCPNAKLFSGKNAFWLQYERIDYDEGTRNYGISVSALVFEKEGDKHLSCTLVKMNHNETEGPVRVVAQGLATIDNNRWLHVELINKKISVHPSVFKFTIAINGVDDQELLTGHFNFFAFSRGRYLTKNVVWVKHKLDPEIRKSDSTLDTDHIFKNHVRILDMQKEQDSQNVPAPIAAFLQDRALNRLTMPRNSFLYVSGKNSQSLEYWLNDQASELPYDPCLEDLNGKYFVIYYTKGGRLNHPRATRSKAAATTDQAILEALRYDQLDVTTYKLKKKFIADFIHYSTVVQSYQGEVTRKRTAVEIQLDDTGSYDRRWGQKNIILLTFTIPPDDDLAEFTNQIQLSSYFTGLISGLSDGNYRSIAYKALIFKQDELLKSDVELKKEEVSIEMIQDSAKEMLLKFFRENAGKLSLQTDPYIMKK